MGPFTLAEDLPVAPWPRTPRMASFGFRIIGDLCIAHLCPSLSVCLPPPGQTCIPPPPGSLTGLPRHFNYPISGILKVSTIEWENVCSPSLGALCVLAPHLLTQVLSPQSSWREAASFPASFTVPCPVPNTQLVEVRSSQTGPLVILCLFLN